MSDVSKATYASLDEVLVRVRGFPAEYNSTAGKPMREFFEEAARLGFAAGRMNPLATHAMLATAAAQGGELILDAAKTEEAKRWEHAIENVARFICRTEEVSIPNDYDALLDEEKTEYRAEAIALMVGAE